MQQIVFPKIILLFSLSKFSLVKIKKDWSPDHWIVRGLKKNISCTSNMYARCVIFYFIRQYYMKHGAQGAQGSHFSQGSQSAHLGSSGFSIQGTHGTQGLHSEHFSSHILQKHLIQSSHFRHFSHSWHLWHFGESQFSPEGSSIHGMHGIHGAQRKQGLQSSQPSQFPSPITSVYVEHRKKFVYMGRLSKWIFLFGLFFLILIYLEMLG